MGKARGERRAMQRARRARRRLVGLGVLTLLVAGAAAWWLTAAREVSGGMPRLVVDRAEVDLGYRRFDTPARVAFTLTNAGNSPLRLNGVPPVILKAGC